MSFRCWGVNRTVFIPPPRHPHASDHRGIPPPVCFGNCRKYWNGETINAAEADAGLAVAETVGPVTSPSADREAEERRWAGPATEAPAPVASDDPDACPVAETEAPNESPPEADSSANTARCCGGSFGLSMPGGASPPVTEYC